MIESPAGMVAADPTDATVVAAAVGGVVGWAGGTCGRC